MERTSKIKLETQMKRHSKKEPEEKSTFEGNDEVMISTGSTLLDLAICGKRKRGGGIPGGILIEMFGPEGSGKTVLLCEIAGAIQRQGGDIQFNDPEARLNKQFAKLFDLDTETIEVNEPNTVTEVFEAIHKWKPNGRGIQGIMTDSLAALSTTMEMEKEDKMGMRRAKEFSEGLRKTCRLLKQNNYIMACSNQIRTNVDATGFGEQFSVPGGKAIAFYASVRLRFHKPEKLKKKIKFNGKEIEEKTGVKVKVEVYKNSCDAPYRTADVYIKFDYGIDDIRANLQYLKDYLGGTTYCIGEHKLDISLDKSVRLVEKQELEQDLKDAVIELWQEIQDKFVEIRKKKIR